MPHGTLAPLSAEVETMQLLINRIKESTAELRCIAEETRVTIADSRDVLRRAERGGLCLSEPSSPAHRP
jgi:hypothetical protein